MRLNKVNRQLVNAMAIGISAGVILFPVTSQAKEGGDEIPEPVVDNNDEESGQAAFDSSSFDEAKEAVSDAGDSVDEAAEAVEAAAQEPAIQEGTYDEAGEALEQAKENISEAAQDLDEASGQAQEAASDYEEAGKEDAAAQDSANEAADTYGEVKDQADSVRETIENVDTDNISSKDFEDIVAAQTENLDQAKEKKAEADIEVMEAEASCNRAELAIKELELAHGEALENIEAAQEELSEAEKTLSDSKESLEAALQKAAEAEAELAGSNMQKVIDAKDTLDGMEKSDAGYTSQLDEVSNLILQYLSIGKDLPQGEGLSFGTGSEEYIIGYVKDENGKYVTDENGEYIPVKESINYRTVTYTIGGVTYTKKFENVQDENGEVLIRELNIDAKKQKVVVQEAEPEYYTSDGGQTYVENDATDIYYIDDDDKTKGFYAINKNETPYSEKHLDLSKEQNNDVYDENGNKDKLHKNTTYYTPTSEQLTNAREVLEGLGENQDQYGIAFNTYQNCKVKVVDEVINRRWKQEIYSEAEARRLGQNEIDRLNGEVVNPDDITTIKYTYVVTNVSQNNSNGHWIVNIHKITTIEPTTTEDVLFDQIVYLAQKYANYTPAKELIEKEVDAVTVEKTTLASTADESYRQAVADHTEKIVNAENAKNSAAQAEKAFEDALEDVQTAREKVEDLKSTLISEEDLSRAKNEHQIALANLEVAQSAKLSAEQAIKAAEEALSNAANLIDQIKSREAADRSSDSTPSDQAVNPASEESNADTPDTSEPDMQRGDFVENINDGNEGEDSVYSGDTENHGLENGEYTVTSLAAAGTQQTPAMTDLSYKGSNAAVTLNNVSSAGNSDLAYEAVSHAADNLKDVGSRFAALAKSYADSNGVKGSNSLENNSEETDASSEITANISEDPTAISDSPDDSDRARQIAIWAAMGVGALTAEEILRRKKLLKNIFKNS